MTKRGIDSPAVIGVFALLVALAPLLITDRYLLKIFSFAGMNTIVVLGLVLLFGFCGQVSLGHGAFMGIGAYTCAILIVRHDVPWLVATIAAIVVSALAGAILSLPALRMSGHYLAMATLGFGELVSFLFREMDTLTGGYDGLGGIPFPSIGPYTISTPAGMYWLVWGVVGLCAIVVTGVGSQALGRSLRAVRLSEPGAIGSGVNITRVKMTSFVLSAAIAGASGALYASAVGFISPSAFMVTASVTFLAMTAIGGHDSLMGPVISAIVLSLLPYIDAFIPGIPREFSQTIQSYQADVYGLALVLIVILAPGGIAQLSLPFRKGRGV